MVVMVMAWVVGVGVGWWVLKGDGEGFLEKRIGGGWLKGKEWDFGNVVHLKEIKKPREGESVVALLRPQKTASKTVVKVLEKALGELYGGKRCIGDGFLQSNLPLDKFCIPYEAREAETVFGVDFWSEWREEEGGEGCEMRGLEWEPHLFPKHVREACGLAAEWHVHVLDALHHLDPLLPPRPTPTPPTNPILLACIRHPLYRVASELKFRAVQMLVHDTWFSWGLENDLEVVGKLWPVKSGNGEEGGEGEGGGGGDGDGGGDGEGKGGMQIGKEVFSEGMDKFVTTESSFSASQNRQTKMFSGIDTSWSVGSRLEAKSLSIAQSVLSHTHVVFVAERLPESIAVLMVAWSWRLDGVGEQGWGEVMRRAEEMVGECTDREEADHVTLEKGWEDLVSYNVLKYNNADLQLWQFANALLDKRIQQAKEILQQNMRV